MTMVVDVLFRPDRRGESPDPAAAAPSFTSSSSSSSSSLLIEDDDGDGEVEDANNAEEEEDDDVMSGERLTWRHGSETSGLSAKEEDEDDIILLRIWELCVDYWTRAPTTTRR